MFGVVEVRVKHPSVGDERRTNSRRPLFLRADFMTVGAAREPRATLVSSMTNVRHRTCALRVEEDLLLEVFTEADFCAQGLQLFADKLVQLAFARDAFDLRAVVRVLPRQTVEEGAHENSIPVWKDQLWIPGIKAELVALFAVGPEGDLLMKRAAWIRFVAISTIQFFSVQGGDFIREMKLMVEAKRVGFAKIVGAEPEFRMVTRQRVEDRRIATFRSGRFEQRQSRREGMIESQRRDGFPLVRGQLHGAGIAMAGNAIRGGRWFDRAGSLMFRVADGAGKVLGHVRLMKRMVGMTVLAGVIDTHHVSRPRRAQLVDFQRARLRAKGRLPPTRQPAPCREMAGSAVVGVGGAAMMHTEEGWTGMRHGDLAGVYEIETPWSTQQHQQHAQCQRHTSDRESSPLGAQTPSWRAFRNAPAAGAVRSRTKFARSSMFFGTRAAVAPFLFARL